MIREYYQLGGFRSHVDWPEYRYDDKRLAQIVAGDNSSLRNNGQSAIELVLGIKRTGTSHLLLTKEQFDTLVRIIRKPYPRAPPVRSTDFESLSPIYFHNATELTNKLGLLKPKSIKNRAATDNSQSNRQYVSGDDGIPRGEYEHGRSFYHVLHNKIDVNKFSLSAPSWKQSVQVCTFSFTQRSLDTRRLEERLKDPSLLDIGIAQATLPDLQYRAESAVHILNTANRNLNAGSQKMPFKHGITNELDPPQISTYLRNFFAERTGANLGPMVLLVHDEEVSKNALSIRGVDTSSWQSGLRGLLGFGGPESLRGSYSQRDGYRTGYGGASGHKQDNYEARRNRPRSRSRSPRRSDYDRHHISSSRNSPPLPYSDPDSSAEPVRKTYAPVYVVDIKQQFTKLMQTASSSQSALSISQYLGLSDVDLSGWCAGNDAVTLIEIWYSMVSGLSIDDQKALKEKGVDQRLRGTSANMESETGPSEYDSDQDPNDIVQVKPPATYDDDSDYGQSSDSDD